MRNIVAQNAKVIEENQNLYKEIKKNNDLCDRQLNVIKNDVVKLDNRVKYIERCVNLKAVNISGMPMSENETTSDLVKIYKKLGGLLKISPSEKDIDDIYRFGKEKKSIRIDFNSKIKKREFLRALRNTEIRGSEIGLSSTDQIFANEHLSKENYNLYVAAKKLKREKTVQFAWVNNGIVLVRKSEKDPAIVIKSEEDLLKLG